MTIQERLSAFWSGERPDQIPYTIYHNEWRHTASDPAWIPMHEAGLGVTYHLSPFGTEWMGVESSYDTFVEGGANFSRQTLKTPAGSIFETWEQGWRLKYLLEKPEDYRVMTWIVENTTVHPRYEAYLEEERNLPPFGIGLSAIGRTPLQTILVDWVGLENFSYHLFEYEEEIRGLYDALMNQFRHKTEIVANGPGRFVSCLENFTAESLGPNRFAEFLLPAYEECFPRIQAAGKIVGCHYDGRTASCREVIARSPIDLIESLTEPPEGDQPLEKARAAWPDKLFWVNIQVGDYDLPADQLREKTLDLVARGSASGCRLAFEVSEQYPMNWRDSIPVVLDALKETRG